MPRISTTREVFETGKIPHGPAEWLALDGVEEMYENIGGQEVQCAVFTPDCAETRSATFFVGGVPRGAERQASLPVVNGLFGYVAAGLAINEANPSYGISFNWPGQGRSEGNIMDSTIRSRADFLSQLVQHFRHKYGLEQINLVGMSMGSYEVLTMLEDLEPELVSSVTLMSPAAYPANAHGVSYDRGFSELIRSAWDFQSSPGVNILRAIGRPCLVAYFEHDNPPIPAGIQQAYRDQARINTNIRLHTILGVGHNFRRPDAAVDARNVIDYAAVRAFGTLLVSFLANKHE